MVQETPTMYDSDDDVERKRSDFDHILWDRWLLKYFMKEGSEVWVKRGPDEWAHGLVDQIDRPNPVQDSGLRYDNANDNVTVGVSLYGEMGTIEVNWKDVLPKIPLFVGDLRRDLFDNPFPIAAPVMTNQQRDDFIGKYKAMVVICRGFHFRNSMLALNVWLMLEMYLGDPMGLNARLMGVMVEERMVHSVNYAFMFRLTGRDVSGIPELVKNFLQDEEYADVNPATRMIEEDSDWYEQMESAQDEFDMIVNDNA